MFAIPCRVQAFLHTIDKLVPEKPGLQVSVEFGNVDTDGREFGTLKRLELLHVDRSDEHAPRPRRVASTASLLVLGEPRKSGVGTRR